MRASTPPQWFGRLLDLAWEARAVTLLGWMRSHVGNVRASSPILLTILASMLPVWGVFSQAVAAPAQTEVSCADCHEVEGSQFAASVHGAGPVECRTCHGGQQRYFVDPSVVARSRVLDSQPGGLTSRPGPQTFDHGAEFRGKAARKDIPERCGSCHSDVAKMNPYALPTDQWAQYRLSGHGRALYERNETQVAVCTDCHGVHQILAPKDPESSVYPKNIPATCGRCHSDPAIVGFANLSTRVVSEYKASVHGKGLLERNDIAMPECATCHGSHSAVPPGFRDVGHVCGRCHQQEQRFFLESPHAKFPSFPRCVGCHTKSVDKRDHLIFPVSASPESLTRAYRETVAAMPGVGEDDPRFVAAFAARRQPPVEQFEAICQRCHSRSREVGHRVFLAELDVKAAQMGTELYRELRHAELCYAVAATRTQQVGSGVLLVSDEALVVEEMRTSLVGMGPLQHCLDPARFAQAGSELAKLDRQVESSLDAKVAGLRWRYRALLPMWAFAVVFVILLWKKYKRLHAQMVAPLGPGGLEVVAPPEEARLTRRGALEWLLGACGTATGVAMAWLALAYVWPVAKAGPVKTREQAGDDKSWEVWQARKVAVGGKPALVIKTDQGYKAFSAVCTHLGCLVEFDAASRSIHCPCHAAVFDLEGRVVGGPPPRPLPLYKVSVVQGVVYVSL